MQLQHYSICYTNPIQIFIPFYKQLQLNQITPSTSDDYGKYLIIKSCFFDI